MTPIQRYQQDVDKGKIYSDPHQRQVMQHLETLYHQLNDAVDRQEGVLSRIKQAIFMGSKTTIKGIYLWGGVGRGKTYMVDLFFDCLPFANKTRIHFHRFMQAVHQGLRQYDNHQDPLPLLADDLAQQTKVICFDEFHVADITDAMLLGGLFTALFARGVTLVATSNVAPDKLYWGGLQRERFIPAIDLLKLHTEVVQIGVKTDYRLRYLDKAKTYHYPLTAQANELLEQAFLAIAPDAGRANSTIEVENRKIRALRFCDGVIWFEFEQICDGPRGPADYIEIARQFQTVLISNVLSMEEEDNDLAKRFITLVDEFYDRNVKLILSAQTEVSALYQGHRLAEIFARTESRLIEMQTYEYLSRAHLLS